MLNEILTHSNYFFSSLLSKIPLYPTQYSFLFPTKRIDLKIILDLYDTGIFPRLADLAPAFTYAVLLSIARFVLQRVLIIVSRPKFLHLHTASKLIFKFAVMSATGRVLYEFEKTAVRSSGGY